MVRNTIYIFIQYPIFIYHYNRRLPQPSRVWTLNQSNSSFYGRTYSNFNTFCWIYVRVKKSAYHFIFKDSKSFDNNSNMCALNLLSNRFIIEYAQKYISLKCKGNGKKLFESVCITRRLWRCSKHVEELCLPLCKQIPESRWIYCYSSCT